MIEILLVIAMIVIGILGVWGYTQSRVIAEKEQDIELLTAFNNESKNNLTKALEKLREFGCWQVNGGEIACYREDEIKENVNG